MLIKKIKKKILRKKSQNRNGQMKRNKKNQMPIKIKQMKKWLNMIILKDVIHGRMLNT